jgi:hypothetical protein
VQVRLRIEQAEAPPGGRLYLGWLEPSGTAPPEPAPPMDTGP